MAVLVTRDLVRAFSATCKTVFEDAFATQAGTWNILASIIPSTLASEEYNWLGQLPIMREFKDERQIQALKEYGFTIKNRKFEATIGVQRDALEDEQHGQVKMRVQSMAEAASWHYDQLLFELINGNGLAYDGLAFYAAARGNLLTGAASALSADTLASGITTMRKQKIPDTNEPLDVRPTHLLVGPDLQFKAAQILNSAYYPEATAAGKPGSMAQNVMKGVLELVVSPRLATATEWHIVDASHAVRPFLIQQRKEVDFQSLDGAENETEVTFLRDEFLYGVRSRDAAGFGLPQYAYKSAGA